MTIRIPWVVLTTALAIIGSAHAEEPATTGAGEDKDAQQNEVVVVAPDQQTRIDRRVYTVRNDAEAQSTDMFEILGRIPSVSVSPEGEISLLGAPSVQIQINGQPVPGQTLEQVLRGIPGNQVARIEVITNPAAQFSASASGGIINIITKDRFAAGLAGSVRANIDNFGGGQFSVAPSWSGDKLTLSGWGGAYKGGEDRSEEGRRNFVPNGPNETKAGTNGIDFDGIFLGGSASYKPDSRRRYALDGGAGTNNYAFDEAMTWTRDVGPASLRTRADENTGRYGYFALERQQEGKDNPLSRTKLKLEYNNNSSDTSSLSGDRVVGATNAARFRVRGTTDDQQLTLKLDAERPHPQDRFLTWGAQLTLSRRELTSALELLEGAAPAPFTSALDGEARTAAAYATYQFSLADWTILPGVRVEDYWREVSANTLQRDDDDMRAFPSVYFRRKLHENWNMDLSYAARINRPGFELLDPSIRYFGQEASTGNPDLDPTTIDAFEAAFSYRKNARSAQITAFNRITSDIVGTRRDLVGDFFFSRPINFGESVSRGIELQARGPIGTQWNYTLNGNVLERAFDGLRGGTPVQRSVTQYGGSARIEYRDGNQEAIGADQVQVNFSLVGPTYDLQAEARGFATLDVTWRRRLAKDVVGVLSVGDVFASRIRTTEVFADNYFQRNTRDSPGARVRFTLTYEFGDPAKRQQAPNLPQAPGG